MMKKTQGKKKIEIKKIDERRSLQVTFSKRRAGLFKKASELCVSTGAETAIILQSPGGHVFAFGCPSVDSVVDQYLAGSSENEVDEGGPFWWEQPFDNLGVEELQEYVSSLEALKNNVLERANEMNMKRNSMMFNVNQSSKNEGSDMLLVNKNAARYEFGNQQMHPCPPGFNMESGGLS